MKQLYVLYRISYDKPYRKQKKNKTKQKRNQFRLSSIVDPTNSGDDLEKEKSSHGLLHKNGDKIGFTFDRIKVSVY